MVFTPPYKLFMTESYLKMETKKMVPEFNLVRLKYVSRVQMKSWAE
jgi:hypothetical protein